jgi:hypothetical protein
MNKADDIPNVLWKKTAEQPVSRSFLWESLLINAWLVGHVRMSYWVLHMQQIQHPYAVTSKKNIKYRVCMNFQSYILESFPHLIR